ncbi:FecR family protein [Pelagibius sp.]|uniref:FecR family protein n=1 Tax=Pelagibius sp. TaxID=1931238 RepID=UPI003BB1AFEB
MSTGQIEDTAQDWFVRLASGEVSETDLAAFRAWCEADPRHSRAFSEIRDLWNDIGDLETAFAGSDEMPAANAVSSRGKTPAARSLPPRHRRFTGPLRRPTAIAGLATALLAALVVLVIDLPIWLMADHRTGVGEQSTVTLPDGSLAYLNTDTAISVTYSKAGREVSLLSGEALFEVAKDPARPFAVLALQGRATATGTAFVVHDRGTTATVTVTEGSVDVVSPISDPGSRVAVKAGQQVSYVKGGKPGSVGQVDLRLATPWRNRAIIIDSLPLTQAIEEIDRYLPGRILLLTDTSGFEPVTARLSLDAVDSGLNALADTHQLSVTRITNYLTILR